jgi:hypothetical protein
LFGAENGIRPQTPLCRECDELRLAAVTLAGLELVHRIRKRQFKFGPGWWSRWSLKKQWDVALA